MAPNCCTCCTGFITSAALTFLLFWLTLRTQYPKCFIKSLYIPSLNKTITSNHNHNHSNNNTIVFNLKFVNQNKDKGVQYDAVNLTFKLFLNVNTTRPLTNVTLDGFYQGHDKTTEKWSSGEIHGGGVNRTVQGSVFFRVEFATRVKYKILFFYTKRHRLSGGANVEVNVSSGEKVNPKGIRLGNVPARIGSEAAPVREYWFSYSTFFVSLLFLAAFT
ncbi:hypothetical protein P8452_31667 [Trifolium repens]|nr:hypothetical protein P8452_31667 [Trifolium repens]